MAFHWTNDHRNWYRNVYLRSEHWRDLRKRKLSENPCCEECGSKAALQIHHLRYKNIFDVELSDLKTLCDRCHDERHRQEGMPTRKRPALIALTPKEKEIAATRAAIVRERHLSTKKKKLTKGERDKRRKQRAKEARGKFLNEHREVLSWHP